MANEIEVEALACPFCGSENISGGEVMLTTYDNETITHTQCMDCGACGPAVVLPEGDNDYGDIKANTAWNRRAAIAAAQEKDNG